MLSFLGDYIAPVFYALLSMSVTALLVGLVVVLLRWFADKRFSPIWKYTMWGLVFIALLLPWRVPAPAAMPDATQDLRHISFALEYRTARAEYELAVQEEPIGGSLVHNPSDRLVEAQANANTLFVKSLIIDGILPALWLCGTVLLGLFLLIGGRRLRRNITRAQLPVDASRYYAILHDCQRQLGIRRFVGLELQDHVKTPALLGVFHPIIVLPDYVQDMSDAHVRYIILHELSHHKRGDAIVNSLLLALQCVYWFNPLIRVLFRLMREDMELANDAAVLAGMGEDEKKQYSLSLVEVLARYGKPPLTPRLLCVVDSEKNLTRRIHMIKLGAFFKRRKWAIATAALAIIAITATLFLTTNTADRYKISLDATLRQQVAEVVQAHYDEQSQAHEPSRFTVTATDVLAAYHQNGRTRAFVTVYFCEYFVPAFDGSILRSDQGFDTVAITFLVPLSPAPSGSPDQALVCEEFTRSAEGNAYVSSVRDFCRLPSGQKIPGLANDISRNQPDGVALGAIAQQKYDAYIRDYGLEHYTLQDILDPPEAFAASAWAASLQVTDVARIEAVILEAESAAYRDLTSAEIARTVARINEYKGPYVPSPSVVSVNSHTLYLTMRDGSLHFVANHDDRYLVIDDTYWLADAQWLSEGFGDLSGTTSLPDDFQERVLNPLDSDYHLWQQRTPHVTDTQKIDTLIELLGDPLSMRPVIRRYAVDETARTLTFSYEARPWDVDALRHNSASQTLFATRAMYLLCLIGDLQSVRFEIAVEDGEDICWDYTRAWANTTVGGDVGDYARDFAAFKAFSHDIFDVYFPPHFSFPPTDEPA